MKQENLWDLALYIWAVSQLAPGEGIEDSVLRIAHALHETRELFNHNKGDQMILEIVRLNLDVPAPYYATTGSAAFDVHSTQSYRLEPGQQLLMPTGLVMKVPVGHTALVLPRSGQTLKKQLSVSNSPGVIDSDYRDEVKILIRSLNPEPVTIEQYERVAQMMIVPYIKCNLLFVEQFSDTEILDRVGGFGSTGC